MKDFNLHTNKNMFSENTYCISRSSHSYAFFTSEFTKDPLSRDIEGNILLTYKEVKRNCLITRIFQSVKEYLSSRENRSVGIPVGSQLHTFFITEYPHQLTEDAQHNIIVPEEICEETIKEQKIKVKR